MTLDGTRTFLLGEEHPLVIDPGPDDEEHAEAILRALGTARPAAILLTHLHGDHSGAASALAAATGAPVRVGEGAARMVLADDVRGPWLRDGEAIACDAGRLTAHATPGHAPEHFVFLLEADGSRALFAGDLFLGAGDTTLVAHPHGVVRDYLRSLEVVRRLRPTLMYPAHGRALRRPASVVARYRAHRMERIGEVREARRRRPDAQAEDLVAEIYGAELDPRLQRAAVGSVLAMLTYLDTGPEETWRTG